MSRPILIAPSLLSSDFARLAEEVERIEAAGADWLHVDVMDGHFVPNLTIGPPVVASIARCATKPLDVHLMITDPLGLGEAFARAGATGLTFHVEAVENPEVVIQAYRALGVRVGITLNPDTDVSRIEPHVEQVDLVLVMSVFPGFAGQRFLPHVLDKVRRLRELGYEGDLEIDGGINADTLASAVEAGANVLVAGSYVFGSSDPAATIADMRRRSARALAS